MSGLLAMTLMAGCSGEQPPESNNNKDTTPGNTGATVVTNHAHANALSESPNIQKQTFYSNALGRDMNMNIYLPPDYQESEKYPVLYLIHGYGGNEDIWTSNLSIGQVADKLIREGSITPLIIVTPQIDNSYGFNSNTGHYSDYLIHDLIPYIDEHLNTIAERESRYIGGVSMGGWAALHNAFLYPELFSKVGGHSPAIWMDDWSKAGSLQYWLYPTDDLRKQRDPYLLADTADLSGMQIYLDCGDQDYYGLYIGAEALDAKLRSRNIASEFHLSPGDHDDAYLTQHLEEYLLFYAGKSDR